MIKLLIPTLFAAIVIYLSFTNILDNISNVVALENIVNSNESKIQTLNIFKEISPIEYNIVFVEGRDRSIIYIDFANDTPTCIDYVKINNKITEYNAEFDRVGIKIEINHTPDKPFDIEIGFCGKFLRSVII